jgi:cation:H+ antiporter
MSTRAGSLKVMTTENRRRKFAAFIGALVITTPALFLRVSGTHLDDIPAAVVFGLGIVGAAFLLTWAAEALELDVSRGLAIGVLALIAVLPEYAVDFTCAYKAGNNLDYAPLALANMTGSNRLLIGIGWPLVVFIGAWKLRKIARRQDYSGPIDTEVKLARPQAIEVVILAMATIYSLSLPLKNHITPYDAVILIGLYFFYVARIWRAPAGEPELEGPAQLLGELSKSARRLSVAGLLMYSGLIIWFCAEPFAEALISTGEATGISTFLLVQWVAPLATESPELLVAGLFAYRLKSSAGLGVLVSSKVNQWTLLVGCLPLVFIIAGGAMSGLPIDVRQREELFLTAAQSAFAVAILMNRSLSVKEAWWLLGLFLSQFVLGAILPPSLAEWERIGVGIFYLVLAGGVLITQRRFLGPILRDGLRTPAGEMIGSDERN